MSTPKWLTKFLEFKGLETGIFRVNKVVEGETPLDVLCSQTKKSDIIPDGFVEYETEPREYRLNSISTIINVNTAIEDVYSAPYDQVQEQLGLAIESLRERQESQLINNDDYGLLKNIADSQRIQTRNGAPTPDDLDELISKVTAGSCKYRRRQFRYLERNPHRSDRQASGRRSEEPDFPERQDQHPAGSYR